MKYGTMRWLAVMMAVAGLTMSGCSRSGGTQSTPVDQFTGGPGNQGSGVTNITNAAGTFVVGSVNNPSYQINPLTSPASIVPTRATTTSVAMSGIFSGAITSATAADRMRVYADRIPWGTSLGANGQPTCDGRDWLVIDTGAMNSAAIDPDGNTDGVSACTNSGGACAALGYAPFAARSGFIVAGAAGNGSNPPGTVAATTVAIPGGSNSTAGVCDAIVPVRVTPSGGSNRAWATLSEFPVKLLPSEFWVTFRFEFFRNNNLTATTYSACAGGCFDPMLTLGIPIVSSQARTGDFPFSFDALPPRIDVTPYDRAIRTFTVATAGPGAINNPADVDSTFAIGATTFSMLDTSTAVTNPETEFQYVDADGSGTVNAADADANGRALAALINLNPSVNNVIRAYASGATVTLQAINRGTGANALIIPPPPLLVDPLVAVNTGGGVVIAVVPYVASDAGQNGASAVASLVTGGVPRQMAFGPIGFTETFTDLATTQDGSLITLGEENFTAMNAQSGDIVTFLSDLNNGRTRPIAQVSVDSTIQENTGGSTTVVTSADPNLSNVPDYYVGGSLEATFGTAANLGQRQTIVDYNGAGVFTVSPGFSNANAATDGYRLRTAGAGTSPNGVLLTTPALADSSAAVMQLAHADIQALRPKESGGAVIYTATNIARTNSALVSGVVQEGRPSYIYFETSASGAPGPDGGDLLFVTTQTGFAANHIRVELSAALAPLSVTVDLPSTVPGFGGYVGGPDNTTTGADEGNAIVHIGYTVGATTLAQIYGAVINHPAARQFVSPVFNPVNAAATVPAHVGTSTIPENIVFPAAPTVDPVSTGGFVPAVGTGVASITINGVNANVPSQPAVSAVISRSSAAADKTTATAVTEDRTAGGVAVPNTAIRFYARTAGNAGNGISVAVTNGALGIAEVGPAVTITVPAGTTSDEIVEFVNNGDAAALTNDDGSAGGRDDVTFTNVTPGSTVANGFDVSIQIINGATPDVSVTTGPTVAVVATVVLGTTTAAELVNLINTDPEAQLYVTASLAATAPLLAQAVQAGAPTATTFVGPNTLSATDDFYTGGTITFTTAANIANQGVTRQIIDYVGATNTFTVSPAFPAAATAADLFTVVNSNDGQFPINNALAATTTAGGLGRSTLVKAMHDGTSTGAGVWDAAVGVPVVVTTYGGATPTSAPVANANANMTGRLVSSNANVVIGQFQGSNCLPSFLDETVGGQSSICFTASMPVAEGTTNFNVIATDGTGNQTTDASQSAMINLATFTQLFDCSSAPTGVTVGAADRCEIQNAAGANLDVIRDLSQPVLAADLEGAYDTTRYETLASIDCSAAPANSFCSQPVFVIPANAPSGGGSYTSFSPTVTVGGHVLDKNANASAFDTAAAGMTLVRIQSDNGYDSFSAPTGLDDNGSPVPYTDGDAVPAENNGYYQYSNISLRTGALTQFTVTAWDQAGNMTTFNFAVRQFEGNVKTPPHFAIDCIVEDTPQIWNGASLSTTDAGGRAVMCENDIGSRNPNTPIIVRTLDTANTTGSAGGRFGDLEGEQGPTVTTPPAALAGSNATTIVFGGPVVADDFFVGDTITAVTGALANIGQSRTIVDFVDATGTVTVSPAFPVAVAPGDTFSLASYGLFNAGTATLLTTDAAGTNVTLNTDETLPYLSDVNDAYTGGTVTVVTTGGDVTGTGTVTDYDAATATFTIAGLGGTTSNAGDTFILRSGDGRNYRGVGELANLGAGVMPQIDFRTVSSDRMYLQGRSLSLDASNPTVYLGADPTIVNSTSDVMPADGNSGGANDFLRLVQTGGNGGSTISIAAPGIAAADNMRLGDFIALSSLDPTKSPNIGLYRVVDCGVPDANGYCNGAGPKTITLDKPLPADATGMFLQAAYVWTAPNVPVPVEGINSYLFVAIDSMLTDPADPTSGNQSVTPFAVIRDMFPPSIVVQGIVSGQSSIGYNPVVFITDETLFLGNSASLPAGIASRIEVSRQDSFGEDNVALTAHVPADLTIYADSLVSSSAENTPNATQSLLSTQTSLGQARAALLDGTPAKPLAIDNSCNDNHADGANQCQAGDKIQYRVVVQANDRVNLRSPLQVQFDLVESATDRVLSGALDVISTNPAVVSLLSDPTELSTLTLDQLSNSGVFYNLNYHMSVLLGSPNDTASSNPRQAFYQDSRSDFGIVLGTLLQDTDGTGSSESTVVILSNVGRILLDNGVLDDLLPLLDDQAIINPRARNNFPAGPRTDPGDATLSSIFLEEIMRDAAESATPCNVGVNSYNCYSQPGTVKNTLPMVKAALDSEQSLRARAADTAAGANDSLNARTTGIDLVVDTALVANPASTDYWAQVESATGGFLPLAGSIAQADSEINVQEDDIVEITTGACAGAKARVKKVANANNIAPYNGAVFTTNPGQRLFVEPFVGVFASTTTAIGTATTLVDNNLRDGVVDGPTYSGKTITFLTGANAGQTAVVLSPVGGYNGTDTLTFGNCQPSNAACNVVAAGDQYSVGELLSTACVNAGPQSFRVMQPQGPSMEPIFDLVDNLLFLDLDNNGFGGEREVIQSLIFSMEEAMANADPSTTIGGLGSYPQVADRISLVCSSADALANNCPNTLTEIHDRATSLQGVLDLVYELSDDQNPFTGFEFIPRVLNIATAALSQYPREATNPLAPNGATVLEAVSFILRDMLTDQTTGGLLAEPSKATAAYTSLAAESGADDYKNSRLNLMMRSTYIMGPNGAFVSPTDDQTVVLKGSTNVTVTNILEALFPLLQSVTDDPDDNPRGVLGAPPFTYTVGQSVAEKLLPAVDLVLRDKRLEDLIADLSAVLDPGTSVSDLTAFDYTGPVLNTGYADQAANPYTVNPPLLKVVAELSGAKINYNLDASTRSTLDYTNDALNVLLTRVGMPGLSQDNAAYPDGHTVATDTCDESYFNGRTPMEMLLEVMSQLVDTSPKDPRTSNFRDAGCTSTNLGTPNANRSYLRVLVDGLFDDPNTQDIGASDAAVNDKTDFDDYPGSPVANAAYPGAGCTTNRGPNGGDGIAVAQSTLDILPEVLNTMIRFGFNEQDQITSIFSKCIPAAGAPSNACRVNNGYPNGVNERWLSNSRLGIDLAIQFDKPFRVGSGPGFIRFEQSLVREALEQISVMSSTQAVNYILLLVTKIAEDIQPINGTLSVPNPQDIARSSASVRALADPDGDGNPAPDGLLDDIIPVAQALGASGLADQTLKLLRAVRACGVDTTPGAGNRDIKGGELLKSSEDLTLILLDAFSGAKARDDDNDGTGRNVDTLTAPDSGAPFCPATAPGVGVDPAQRGYTGGPLDQNPPRETVTVTGGAAVTTVDVDATAPGNATLNLNPGFYSGTLAYAPNGAGLITFKSGLAKGLTRRISNYTVAGNVGTITFATTGGPLPAIGDQIELSLSSVNVGAVQGGNDIALTSDGAFAFAEARVWGAATDQLPPSTTDFNASGVGPGSFLCVQSRAASEDGGFDEICSPVTSQPPVTAPNGTVCSGHNSRNCLQVEQPANQAANWGNTYDDVTSYMTQHCNQIEYTTSASTAATITISNAALRTAAQANANTWFNGHTLIATTTGGGLTNGDQLVVTATAIGVAPDVTFTVTGATAPGLAGGQIVRFFDGQQCSYRVRQMREPFNGCFGGSALGGQGLGLALSSFGGASAITINPFRDSRMDLLIRAANSLADGVNAVDIVNINGTPDQDFFDRVLALVAVAVQPNTDPLAANNRSIASNLIFGPDGTDGTGQGPVQRMLNDDPTRSAVTAAGSLFAKLTAHAVAPAATGEDVYDRYPNFDPTAGWPEPALPAACTNTATTCEGNAINDAVDYQLLAVAGILETLGDRNGADNILGANTNLGDSRQGFSDDPRMLFNIVSQFIEADLIRQLIPGIQIITEQTDLVPAGARDTKTAKVTANNAGFDGNVATAADNLIIEGKALTNIISRTARSVNGDTNGISYDSRIYDGASYPTQQRPIITGTNISPTYGLVKTVVALLDDWEQNVDYEGLANPPFSTANAEYQNNLRYRNKLVALEDLAANLIGSQRVGVEHPFNTQNYLGKALKLLTDIVNDTDTVSLAPGDHDRTIDNILSVQIGLSQRDIIDTPTVVGTDYYRSGMDVVGDFLNTMLEDPTDCDTVTAKFQRGVTAANTYNACVGAPANGQAVFRDRGALVERPLQPILDENLFSSLSVLLAGDANSKVIGALPFISALIDGQTYALDNDPVSGTSPLPPTGQGNAPGCATGGANRQFCGVEYTAGISVADALFADVQTLIPGSATVSPRVKREDDENRYDPLITDDLNRNGFVGDGTIVPLQGIFDTRFTAGGPWYSVFDAPAVAGCTTNCPDVEVDNIVFDCSAPTGTPAGTLWDTVACTNGAGDPAANKRLRIGFTATDGVVTQGNVNGINAALFDGLADLIAREDTGFIVNNQIPRTSTQLQTLDELTVRQLDVSSGRLPVDKGFVDLVTALGDILIKSSVH